MMKIITLAVVVPLLLLGCSTESGSQAPDVQATVAAAVRATVAAQQNGTSTSTSSLVPTPTLRPTPMLIVNDPSELDLSIQDFPFGWQTNGETNISGAHQGVFLKAGGGLLGPVPQDLVQSKVNLYPSISDASNAFNNVKAAFAKTHVLDDPKIGEESYSYEGGDGYQVAFRTLNVVGTISMPTSLYGGSLNEAIQWATKLKVKMDRVKRLGAQIPQPQGTAADVTPLPSYESGMVASPVPTLAASSTPTYTPTATPSPTPTLIPTVTPRPTATPTPNPLAALRLVFSADFAYSALDDNLEIYTVDASGENLKRLTYAAANDDYPVWSPDGKHIAFVSARNGDEGVYTMNPDGSNQTRIATGTRPVWSPDGTKLAFESSGQDGRYAIHLISGDGSNQRPLTSNTLVESCPSWSPDGSRIAFITSNSSGNRTYVVNLDGSAQTLVYPSASGDVCPAWSPDGKWLAVQANFTIHIVEVDGSRTVELINKYAPVIDSNPAWSSDGKQVIYNCGERVCTMNPYDTSGGTTPVLLKDVEGYYCKWAPDGLHFACTFRNIVAIFKDGHIVSSVPRSQGNIQFWLRYYSWLPTTSSP